MGQNQFSTDVDNQTRGGSIELIDGFADHDAHVLALLDTAGRVEQSHARQVLYGYLDRLWEGRPP